MYRRPWLATAIAVVCVAVSMLLVSLASGIGLSGLAGVALVTAASVLPLLVAVFAIPAATAAGRTSAAIGMGTVRMADVFIGLCAGLVMRAAIEIVFPTVALTVDPWASGVLASLVVAVLISPVVEELFFRGVVQRALVDALRSFGRVVAIVASIVVSTLLFAGAHAATGPAPVATLVSSIVVGVGCGVVAAVTGRTTGAIAAHLVYNTVGVILLLG